MNEKVKNTYKLILRLLIAGLLLFWVSTKIDFQQFVDVAIKARWEFLLLTWALSIIAFWLLSFKMRLILKQLDCDASTRSIFFASAISSLYGMILPGFLDASAKWYVLKLHTGKPSHILSGMVYNQFTSTIIIIVFGLIALIYSNPSANLKLPLVCAVFLVITVFCCFLLFNHTTGPKLNKLLTPALKLLPTKFNNAGNKILHQLSIFQISNWKFHFAIVSLTSIAVFLTVVIYVFAAKAAGISVPFGVLVWQSCLVYLLGRLPITIANLGVREVTIVESLAAYGATAPQALLMSGIIFSSQIFLALIGAICQISWIIKKKQI